jgi:hypothetical protein
MSLDPFPCTRAAVPLLGYGRGKAAVTEKEEKRKKREITINYYVFLPEWYPACGFQAFDTA